MVRVKEVAGLPVTVHIHTRVWGNEITWNIDDGHVFGPYQNYQDYYEPIVLLAGEHTISYMDSYGDGWHGGYWEISSGNDVIAGGETEGGGTLDEQN